MIKNNSKIYVSGHHGLVGSAIMRRLKYYGFKNIFYASSNKLDLRNQKNVDNYFKKIKPDAVINAAAMDGGIDANNKYRAEFIYNNSCIYPRNCKQPIKEDYLLTGKLEKSNEPYAIAKIAGVKMCENYNYQYGTNYKCLMPCNTYGPNDNYNLQTSHFFPALIKKIHKAKVNGDKQIILWGSGKPKREIMYVDDVADACIFFLNKKTKETIINIGSEKEKKKLDGTPRKIMNSSIAKKYGWKAKVSLKEGFNKTYTNYIKNLK